MINRDFKIIIITPVYEDVEASKLLFADIKNKFNQDVYLVVIDDGSVKYPLKINCLEEENISGVVLKLKSNVGHQRAIAIGLSYVAEFVHSHQNVVIMDSDGEDLPSSIFTMLQELKDYDVDVVFAKRKSRNESIQFKTFYIIYKTLFRVLTGRVIGFGNFMIINAKAVKSIVLIQECQIHFAAAILRSKLSKRVCPIDRGKRLAGHSKMNFIGLVLHGLKGLMVFAEEVLVRVGIASSFIAMFSIISAITAISLKFYGIASPGWFSISLGILFIILLHTITIALISLMTLMLIGVMRSNIDEKKLFYKDFL